MKNKILIVAAIFGFANQALFAQSKVAFFQVENKTFVVMEDFLQNEKLEYYSQFDGGVNIGKTQVSSNYFQEQFNCNSTPKMIIDRKSTENLNGTNKVYFLDTKEFNLKNLVQKTNGLKTIISWEASVSNYNDISFRIMKSINNSNFETVAIINSKSNNTFCNYEYAVDFEQNAVYKLEVIKSNAIVRYSTTLFKLQPCIGLINVYPTVSASFINVDLFDKVPNIKYIISDNLGKKIAENYFDKLQNEIDISNYKSGLYFIQVYIGNKIETFKIIKQ